jgi:hypothetical protein
MPRAIQSLHERNCLATWFVVSIEFLGKDLLDEDGFFSRPCASHGAASSPTQISMRAIRSGSGSITSAFGSGALLLAQLSQGIFDREAERRSRLDLS